MAYTPAELAILRTELADARYANKTHVEIKEMLRVADRDVPNDTMLTGSELFELLDYAEYTALPPTNRTKLFELLSLAPLRTGPNFQAAFNELFAPGSKTRTNVSKKYTRKGAKWEELKIPIPTESDVADALR